MNEHQLESWFLELLEILTSRTSIIYSIHGPVSILV